MATKKQCERALSIYEDELGARRNVVGLGIVPTSEGKGRRRDHSLAVYVRKKLPKARLAAKDIVPPVIEVQSRGRRYKVQTRVIEQGEVVLE